ncbi:alpha/beta fold hydrolase [Burkholderia pseudomallei]|nr:alpha/beta hydrolase [Burkholderia pseudomallei]
MAHVTTPFNWYRLPVARPGETSLGSTTMLGCTLVGEGLQKVIMLHGWFGGHEVYEPMSRYLDPEAFTYAFADFRGYGKSRGIAGNYTMHEMVDDVFELADALGWRHFHVTGHSMGGKVAQLVAARDAVRVSSAIALTPVPASGIDVDAKTWQLFERAVQDDTYRRGLVDFSTGGRLPARWVDRIVRESRTSCDQGVFGAYLLSWAKDDCSDNVRGCKVPLLFLVGQHDPAQTEPVMRSTCMTWFENARVAVLEGSGHYPMQEVPAYLVAVMERYFHEQFR